VGAAAVLTGVLNGAPTLISHLWPGCPWAGFRPAVFLDDVTDVCFITGVVCGEVITGVFGEFVITELFFIPDVAVVVSENKVSAIVTGVTGFVAFAGTRVLSIAVSLLLHDPKINAPENKAMVNTFFIYGYLLFQLHEVKQFANLMNNHGRKPATRF